MEGLIILQTVVTATKSLRVILWEFILSHIEWISGLTVTFGTFLTFQVKKIIKWVKEMNLLKQAIPDIHSKLDSLMLEFKINGGNSLKDQINRIEKRGILTQQLAWSQKEQSPDGEFTADESGAWTRVNRTMMNLLGANEDQLLKHGWVGYLSDSDAEDCREKYLDAVNESRGVSFKCHFKRNGSYDGFWSVLLTLTPLRSDGQIISFTGTIKLIK